MPKSIIYIIFIIFKGIAINYEYTLKERGSLFKCYLKIYIIDYIMTLVASYYLLTNF